MDAATLTIFNHLFASVAEEMGVTLNRAAYSPNIKERLDYSCAVFLSGEQPALLAQAAHIPVHLGAMPASVRAAVAACAPLRPGDVVILNDPYQGGNHLPDITLVSPVFSESVPSRPVDQSPTDPLNTDLLNTDSLNTVPTAPFLVASRAHHADVGGMSPGSMPLSTELYQEGIIIPPLKLVAGGRRNDAVWQLILRNVRTPWERDGDLAAQLAAHATGAARLAEIAGRYGLDETLRQAHALLAYAESLTRAAIARIPDGVYRFEDALDDDGYRLDVPVPIRAAVAVRGETLTVDFAGTAPAVAGNLNAVPAIVESAVVYCLRCVALALLGELPMNQGVFAPLTVCIPPGSVLDPRPPHAVAAGNVETAQRVVDVVFGALAEALPDLIPAASQGTMNNLTFGGNRGQVPGSREDGMTHDPVSSPLAPGPWPLAPSFAYYETIGGGAGAGPAGDGASGVHVHMSNTRNTPVEALEYSYPIRVETYALRRGSGGRGRHSGGDGLLRAIRFLSPATATITSERRRRGPYGLSGGEAGAPGRNALLRDGQAVELPGKATLALEPGDVIRLETPGGGGWGEPG
ncbi:MAG: hydantoinase B/oxoprolinase family protein [Anaerolineae bacterium]|nr:hydantoinase B/oxoprolinase family protein [Anaerolineae bacterium]